ncbi:MAG TPA: tetratricopeptide repeat protein [Polyangia bacterium]|jgi:tetratricopeptide (TPR) repeat protein|nr:tetratricopeptide repeat protein [Polyangia bacterium]
MRRGSAIARWLLAALIAFGAATAHADNRDDAKKHFQAGKRHHDAGEWDAALAEYLHAYQLDPSPAFLFNIGQVYRLKGDRDKALDYYQRYLEAAPHAQGSEEARAFAAKLKTELDAEAAARQTQAAEVARVQAEEQRRAEEAQQQTLEADRHAAEVARANAAEARRKAERRLRYAGIASAAAGAVAIALGVKFGIDARDLQREVTNPSLTMWTTGLDQAASDGQSKNLAMEISIGVGSALVVGGAVLVFLGRPSHEIAVAPLVGAHATGAALGWRF